MKKLQSGFTLIELMIVIAIIAILAGVGYPAYMEYLEKSRRADAQAVLASFANRMERYYTENYTYLGAANGGGNTGAPDADIFPSEAPLDGDSKYYDLTIDTATATSYTLRATPKGPQSGDGFMEITSTGQKGWDKNDDGAIVAGDHEDSWR